jgi:hypothetical protein
MAAAFAGCEKSVYGSFWNGGSETLRVDAVTDMAHLIG